MVQNTDAFWPLILTCASGEITEHDAEAWSEFDRGITQRAIGERREFVFVCGVGGRMSINAAVRKRFSDHLNARPPEDARYRSAVHMVFRSAVARGVVKALGWMSINKSVDKIRAHDSTASAILAARQDLTDLDSDPEIDWDAVQLWFDRWGEPELA